MRKQAFLFFAVFFACFVPFSSAQTQVAPFVNANVQLFDNNGRPCTACKLNTFAAGTSTPQTTYSDSAGTVPNANPIILDSAGRATIYLTTQSYKFQLLTAASVTIWTQDNVTWNNLATSLSSLNVTGNVLVNTSTAATGGANQSGPTDCDAGNYWTGSVSAVDKWCWQDVLGTGSNPTSTYTLTHTGSSGATAVSFPSLTVSGAVTAGSVNAVFSISTSGDVGASYNTKDAAIGSGTPGVIEIPPFTTATATTLITIGKQHVLRVRGQGVLTVAGINFSDSTTDTTGTLEGIECPEHATIKLANTSNRDVISQTNFATLTGTTNAFGVNNIFIRGCIVDGNGTNQASGFGIRLYGRKMRISDTVVQSAKQDGYWLEGHDDSTFVNPTQDDQQFLTDSRAIANGSDGIHIVTQQAWTLTGVATWGNGTWGLETNAATYITNFNSYTNTTGACHVLSGGVIHGSSLECTTGCPTCGVTDGFLDDSGNSQISASLFSGNPAVELKASQSVLCCNFGTPNASGTVVKFNGGGGSLLGYFATGATGVIFDCTAVSGLQVSIFGYNQDTNGSLANANCTSGGDPVGLLNNIVFQGAGGKVANHLLSGAIANSTLQINATSAAGVNGLVLKTTDSATVPAMAIRWQTSNATTVGGIGTHFNIADTGNFEFLNNATTNFAISSTGTISRFATLATSSPGLAPILGTTVNQAGLVANLAATTIYTTSAANPGIGGAGMYRVCAAAWTTVVGNSTVTINAIAPSGAGTVTAPLPQTLNTAALTNPGGGCTVLHVAASSAIQVSVTGYSTTGTYSVQATAEQVF